MATVRFGDVAERVNTKEDRLNTDLVYYVGGEHIESNALTVSGRGKIKEADLGPMFYFGFKLGDILFVTRNPHLRKCATVDFSGICSEKTLVIGTKDEDVLSQKYLATVMQSDDFWEFMEENKSGSVNYFINWSTLADYEFDLPPIARQRELANLLWAANDLKESYKKAITATDEMLKAKFREMFGDAGEEDKVLLGHIVEIMDNRRMPLNEAERSEMKTGTLFPYYGANGVVDYINKYLTDDDLLCVAEDCGSYGPGEESAYIIHGKAWVNNHAHLIKPKKDFCTLEYLHAFLKLSDLRPYIAGTTRQKLTQAMLRSVKCILPTLSLQREFVAIAERADAAKSALKQSIADIDQVMKGLING